MHSTECLMSLSTGSNLDRAASQPNIAARPLALLQIYQNDMANKPAEKASKSDTNTNPLLQPVIVISKPQDMPSKPSDLVNKPQDVVRGCKQTVGETKQTVAESKQTITEGKQTIAEDKGTVAESKRTVAESKQHTAESKPTVAESKQPIAESKPTVAESKSTVAKDANGNVTSRDLTQHIDDALAKVLSGIHSLDELQLLSPSAENIPSMSPSQHQIESVSPLSLESVSPSHVEFVSTSHMESASQSRAPPHSSTSTFTSYTRKVAANQTSSDGSSNNRQPSNTGMSTKISKEPVMDDKCHKKSGSWAADVGMKSGLVHSNAQNSESGHGSLQDITDVDKSNLDIMIPWQQAEGDVTCFATFPRSTDKSRLAPLPKPKPFIMKKPASGDQSPQTNKRLDGNTQDSKPS